MPAQVVLTEDGDRGPDRRARHRPRRGHLRRRMAAHHRLLTDRGSARRHLVRARPAHADPRGLEGRDSRARRGPARAALAGCGAGGARATEGARATGGARALRQWPPDRRSRPTRRRPRRPRRMSHKAEPPARPGLPPMPPLPRLPVLAPAPSVMAPANEAPVANGKHAGEHDAPAETPETPAPALWTPPLGERWDGQAVRAGRFMRDKPLTEPVTGGSRFVRPDAPVQAASAPPSYPRFIRHDPEVTPEAIPVAETAAADTATEPPTPLFFKSPPEDTPKPDEPRPLSPWPEAPAAEPYPPAPAAMPDLPPAETGSWTGSWIAEPPSAPEPPVPVRAGAGTAGIRGRAPGGQPRPPWPKIVEDAEVVEPVSRGRRSGRRGHRGGSRGRRSGSRGRGARSRGGRGSGTGRGARSRGTSEHRGQDLEQQLRAPRQRQRHRLLAEGELPGRLWSRAGRDRPRRCAPRWAPLGASGLRSASCSRSMLSAGAGRWGRGWLAPDTGRSAWRRRPTPAVTAPTVGSLLAALTLDPRRAGTDPAAGQHRSTSATAARAAARRSRRSISIPSAGASGPVDRMGVKGGELQIPPPAAPAGSTPGPRPGEIGRAVIVSHVDSKEGRRSSSTCSSSSAAAGSPCATAAAASGGSRSCGAARSRRAISRRGRSTAPSRARCWC